MKKYLLLLLSIAFISIGCYKDTDNTPPPKIIIETTEVLVNTSISGNVIDLDGSIISDYHLKVNDQINIIPADHFFLQLNDLKKKGQTIHVFKNDQQIGISTQLLVENDINHMAIQQHAEYNQKVIIASDAQINLSKLIVADLSSTKWTNSYTGEIIIDYANIEPTTSLTPIGYNSVSDVLAVDSKGGFYLKAKRNNGEEILADSNSPIVIQTSDLDNDINSLFVFDEEDEVWILVTELTSGDEVEVQGQGYYTFAHYTPGVFVEGIVKKEEKLVAYHRMKWELESMTNQMCTTEKGRWIALLPEQESVGVNLLNPCDESLQAETLDTQQEDLINQDLTIEENDNYQLLDVAILDCNGDAVSSPILNVSNQESTAQYIFSEDYSDRWIAVCDNFVISVTNEITGESGPELSWSTEIEGGLDVLTDCDEYGQGYSYIKIRDDEKIYTAFDLQVEGDKTIMKSQDGNVKFIFKGRQEGMYNVEDVNVSINDIEFGEKGYYFK